MGGPLAPNLIGGLAPILHADPPGGEGEFRNQFDTRYVPRGDYGEPGQIAIMVQEKMQLDGPFGPAKPCPFKQRHGYINGCGIDTH